MSEHECTGNCSWQGIPHTHADTPALTVLPAEPKVPTYNEMAQAIRAFAAELSGLMQEDDQVTDADRVLLGLANRLGASVAHEKPLSEPATPEVAPIAVSSDQGHLAYDSPLVAAEDEIQPWCEVCGDAVGVSLRHDYRKITAVLRLWLDVRLDTTRSGSEAWREYEVATNDLSALARSVLGVGDHTNG